MTGRGSRIRPEAPGYWTSTPHSSPSGRPSARSATTTSMPIASARVRTTSIVCGSASASTTNGPVGLAVRAAHQRHRLGRRGALVEQRGVGGRQPGQVADHGLEVEQRLEPALGDLRLVRRVGGVPGRVLQHVAPDHRRGDGAVVAEPDHRLGRAVARRERAQLARPPRPRSRRRAGRAPRRRGCRRARRRPSALERVEARAARASRRRRPRRARCGGRRTVGRRRARRRRGGLTRGSSVVDQVASPVVSVASPSVSAAGPPELPGPRGPGA